MENEGGNPTRPTGTVPINVGIIAPCDKYRDCKMPNQALGGQFIIERMGHTYWGGTIFCLRCKHHKPVDLFEAEGSDLIVKDPQAEQLVGVEAQDIIKILGTQ